MKVDYCFWAHGPSDGLYMVDRDLHLLVCSLIDSSDKAHYGKGSWCYLGLTSHGHRVTAVLNSSEDVLRVGHDR